MLEEGAASDALLRESAPRALALSRSLCSAACAAPHGLWQWLRVLGLATSPQRFASFYAEALARIAAPGAAPRILVSGAADYATLACVLDALPRAEVTVLDLCETPLALSRWYAERTGARIATARSDVLTYRPERLFDAICTDSFLGQFAPAARVQLLQAWRAQLVPGGAIVTVNRLRPGADPEQRIGFGADQARAFAATVVAAARELRDAALLPEPELARLAADYAARQGAWPIRSRAELAAELARAGFAVVHLEEAPMPGEAPGAPAAPTLSGGSPYARVVARKLSP